jgi:DNA-directed RNA polymerase specialized sigma24 family protein
MPPRNRNDQLDDQELAVPRAGVPTISDRLAAFTMLDAMAEATQVQKTLRMKLVGFTNQEIALMLQTSPAVVSQNLYLARKSAKKVRGAS